MVGGRYIGIINDYSFCFFVGGGGEGGGGKMEEEGHVGGEVMEKEKKQIANLWLLKKSSFCGLFLSNLDDFYGAMGNEENWFQRIPGGFVCELLF